MNDVGAPVAAEAIVREHVAAWLRSPRRSGTALLLRAQPTWSGPATLEIDRMTVHVVEGISPLAILDAFERREPGARFVVLTELGASEVGSEAIIRAGRHQITQLDEWGLVPDLFKVRGRNVPRAVRELGDWMPRALLSVAAIRPFEPAAGGVLSADLVLTSYLASLLGLPSAAELETSLTLERLDAPEVRTRLAALDDDVRTELARSALRQLDGYAPLALAVALQRREYASVSAVGLAVDLAWRASPTIDVERARTRLERYVGRDADHRKVRAFGSAARAFALRLHASGDRALEGLRLQAEALLIEIGWEAGAAADELLPAGLRARAHRVAATIDAFLAEPGATTVAGVEHAMVDLRTHLDATGAADRPVLESAVRLVRWLEQGVPELRSLDQSVRWQVADGAWADRALSDVWHGSSDPVVATSLQSLASCVVERRRAIDRDAASRLTAHRPDGGVLPIEDVLEVLVRPIAATTPVLLIVLDGMSAAASTEIVEEVHRLGWQEATRGGGSRASALTALPSVTRASRTALLTGTLQLGDQATERAAIRDAGGVVFHKDDLRSDGGHRLPATVLSAIDGRTPLVAAVLNTIDDALDKADVDGLDWHVDGIANLAPLLDAAANAGRIVLLASDHGHVVERGGEARMVGDAARWRSAESGAPQSDEVLVEGPRVLAPGGSAVLAVDADLRYAGKRAGYHGGASLAEIAVPVIALVPAGDAAPAGWELAPPQQPGWWNEPEVLAPPVEPVAQPKRRARTALVDPASALFELEQPADGVADEPVALVDRLLASDLYEQRARIARHPVAQRVVAAMLQALERQRGRAHRDSLAVAAGVPAAEMQGVIATLRRALNFDGYEVLSTDADGVTIVLDLRLLRDQFGLE